MVERLRARAIHAAVFVVMVATFALPITAVAWAAWLVGIGPVMGRAALPFWPLWRSVAVLLGAGIAVAMVWAGEPPKAGSRD